MKEESRMQNNFISSPLINLSIKNKKIVESLSPSINKMNRTTSYKLYINQDMINKTKYKKLSKNNSRRKIKYNSISAENLENKKKYRIFGKNLSNNLKKTNNKLYKNSSVDNTKISIKIFNNLNKIQETLLEDFLKIIPKNEKKENNNEKNKDNENDKSNNKEIKKENNFRINPNKNNAINYFNKDNENKYYTVPIKSKTSYNFYPISQSHKNRVLESPNINAHHSHKRIKSTEDKKPQHITRYLDRKKINDLPVTYPLYLSYNNKYNSISEKNRVDKILNKLICLKTHILRDPLNRKEIIKEFFLKNGFDKNKYYSDDSINNFYYYLNQPFSFPPEHTLSDVINDAINFKIDKEQEDNIDMNITNFLDYMPKNRKWSDYGEYQNNKKKIKKSQNGNKIIYNLLMEEIFKRRYINYDNYKNKSLPDIIKDLEFELRQIKLDKMNRLDKYNNLISTRKLQTIKLTDNNKYIPNLCLISRGFKEKCKAVIDKKNKKIIKNMNKQEHLKQINNRLYYDNIRKNNIMEFDRNDIQRKLKLTEFVVMEMAKKKLQILKAQNEFKNILELIKKK